MDIENFKTQIQKMVSEQNALTTRKNIMLPAKNNLYNRYQYPVLTAEHVPVYWRFDMDYSKNPHLLERLSINSVFNSGAIKITKGNYKYCLVPRIEGADRKSFFALAVSNSPFDQFQFVTEPITIPETDDPDINVYDMRLVHHEDGWIYGLFCTERKYPHAASSDTSSAIARCGIVRTKDLVAWERLADLKTKSPQQRNVVLHPEFIKGKYAFYTRPQDGFIEAGTGGGIGWGLSESIEHAEIQEESIVDDRVYHTVKEVKNGLGPAPIKTRHGWLQLAHGVRNTAAGLRYVLYAFMTSLIEPWKVTHRPGGYLMAPQDEERVGDVSNVLFSNGWIADSDGSLYIYYGSSDTRLHVASSSVEKMCDYVMNTPQDGLRSAECACQRQNLIQKNMKILKDFGMI